MSHARVLSLVTVALIPLALVALTQGCEDSEEVEPVALQVRIDDGGLTLSDTELGYRVELLEARLVLEDLQLTISGEAHGTAALDWLLPRAYAHPGHLAGGDVTGELPGRFVVGWGEATEPRELGQATLLPGSYQGANFRFGAADESDGLQPDDPLLGHSVWLKGRATRGEQTWTFEAQLDVASGTLLVGAPFELQVDEDTGCALGLQLRTVDPSERDSLFQKIDFAELDEDGDGQVAIVPGTTAHNVLVRSVQVHDHYGLVALQ